MKDYNDDGVLDFLDEATTEKPVTDLKKIRIKAFFELIGYTEGTTRIKGSDNGYNVVVGGGLFHDYSDHPRVLVDIPRYNIKSSAAGKFQILERYWDHYKVQLGLPDFSPESQDRYAIQQFKERRALEDIEEGRIAEAIQKCSNIWASFPGAGYGQREEDLDKMLGKFDEYFEEELGRV